MTKWFAAISSLVWIAACSFPDYEVEQEPVRTPSCRDGERNGEETGIDCGMLACSVACSAGQGCKGNADCQDGVCSAEGICQEPSCEDEVENGDESDVDCGGEQGCNRCGVGDRCRDLTDCDGGSCDSGQCRAPTCSDALFNQDETDLDCGGSCDGCPDGGECKQDSDCRSGVCPSKTHRCADPSCSDGVQNGQEPGVDCGTACQKGCELLEGCDTAADCATLACARGVCVPAGETGIVLSPVGWVPAASHTFGNSKPENALDGLKGTDWTSGEAQSLGMWFTIDMGAPQAFFSIEIDCLNSEDDKAIALDVWLSEDGTFTTPELKNVPGAEQLVLRFAEVQVARYIKLSLAQGGEHWWRMDEIRVRQ